MITYKSVDKKEELEQILQLQLQNIPAALPSEVKQSEGFVTVQHTLELLTRMNARCPHIIAKEQRKVVGYALCMHPRFREEIEVLKPMFTEVDQAFGTNSPYMVMGQICIDKNYRKQGIFRMLYKTLQEAVSPEFSTIITEVDATNTRSLQAHYAVGFRKLTVYTSQGVDWELIALTKNAP
ncbi:GNAT family N-acetyltransferase [Altibacter sp.]|uniref:GNAT family N-acetyltransferase n=1 Tax=Altibacter sp. TaxID=2024823 RepID=UPI000C935C39|nr:GNAT family N-acetyltransferase [Altibacter sp.]MAP53617.1 GNAT family N-acetyltransferase [Altibacter sp.]